MNILPTRHLVRTDPKSRFIFTGFVAKTVAVPVLAVVLVGGQLWADVLAHRVARAEEKEARMRLLETLATFSAGNLFFDRATVASLKAQAAMLDIRTLLAGAKDKNEKQKKELREQIKTALQDAVTRAREAVAADPMNIRRYFFLGSLYEEMIGLGVDGALQAALQTYNTAASLAPTHPAIPFAKARAAFKAGDFKQAKQFATAALQLKPNYTDAYYLLSQIAVATKNIKEAIAATESAALLSPNNPGLLFQLGVLQYSAKQYAKAAGVLRRAVALNPQYANALFYLALADIKIGNREEALVALKRILKTNPDAQQVKDLIATLEAGKKPKEKENAPSPEPPLKEKEAPKR